MMLGMSVIAFYIALLSQHKTENLGECWEAVKALAAFSVPWMVLFVGLDALNQT
jgi:hypothetical protein